jgi:ribosomal protein S18 acetylase RimI-like enzyme
MLSIRAATPKDAAGLARVHVASWRAVYTGLLPQQILDELSERDLAIRWRDSLEREEPPGRQVLVITDEEAIAGYSAFGPARDQDSILAGSTAEIYGFYLDPERWGQGLGHALMDASVARLASRGFEEATLNVVEGNERARFFYERQGWILDKQAAPWKGAPQLRYRKEL